MIRKIAAATAFVVGLTGTAFAQSGVIVPVLTRDASGAVTTAGTYQNIDVYNQATGSTRKGCVIQNTSANPESIRIGATLTFSLPAGTTFNCASPNNTTISDTIAITSTTAGSTYAAGIQ